MCLAASGPRERGVVRPEPQLDRVVSRDLLGACRSRHPFHAPAEAILPHVIAIASTSCAFALLLTAVSRVEEVQVQVLFEPAADQIDLPVLAVELAMLQAANYPTAW